MGIFDTLLDAAEISLSCLYAAWLHKHKDFEPHMTWAEVAAGVLYTLIFAHLRGALHRDDWRSQSGRTIREFCISAPPIVIGELIEKWEARQAVRQIDKEFPR